MNTATYKVLFLEDEPTIREVLTEYMIISGYKVTAAERGDMAIDLIKNHTYDIAVLDIMVRCGRLCGARIYPAALQ